MKSVTLSILFKTEGQREKRRQQAIIPHTPVYSLPDDALPEHRPPYQTHGHQGGRCNHHKHLHPFP